MFVTLPEPQAMQQRSGALPYDSMPQDSHRQVQSRSGSRLIVSSFTAGTPALHSGLTVRILRCYLWIHVVNGD